jgi:hypothetical protein
MHVLRHCHRRIIRPVFRELTKQTVPLCSGIAPRSSWFGIRSCSTSAPASRCASYSTDMSFCEPWSNSVIARNKFGMKRPQAMGALEQLRALCTQAEGSSILALRKFALRLRTYAPPRST